MPTRLTEVENGRLNLTLHAGQAKAWRSERRFTFVVAGTQGGKTSFGPHWLFREMQRKGPGDYLCVTSTFPLLKLKMLPEFLWLFQHTLRLGRWNASDRIFEVSDAGKKMLRYPADSYTRVIFGSATHPESLESATAKAAWLDECGQDQFRLDSWYAVLRRLALNRGRVLGTTTPYNLGWLKQEIYDRWRNGDPDIAMIQFKSLQNPAFPREEYDDAKRRLPNWKFRMFYDGEFGKPAGLIYGDFDDRYREDGGNKVHPFDLPRHWPRYAGVDFGAVNTATVFLAHDPEADVYYLYHDSLEGGKTSREHAEAALNVARGTNMVSWFGGAKSESQPRMDWGEAGVPLLGPPIADVEAGIDRVISLFKTQRLYVFDSCKGTLDELGTYSRETDDQGEPLEKIKDKATFHRLDALRYVVQGIVRGQPWTAQSLYN